MNIDQATIAGLAALATAAVLFTIRWRRLAAERAHARRRLLARIRGGELPTLPAPPEIKAAARETFHILARAAGKQLDTPRELGVGLLAVSDRRIGFVGTRKLRLSWKKIALAAADPAGSILVRGKDGRRFAFALARGEDAELIGAMLGVLDAALVTSETEPVPPPPLPPPPPAS